jgi:hypothetical protein
MPDNIKIYQKLKLKRPLDLCNSTDCGIAGFFKIVQHLVTFGIFTEVTMRNLMRCGAVWLL